MKNFIIALLLTSTIGICLTSPASAQSTEERFHDLFVTAGYSTAFGAALGAAFLSFTSNPASELRYIAVGASLGFIGGSILGSYVIFSPYLASAENNGDTSILLSTMPVSKEKAFVLRPVYNTTTNKIASVEGAFTILRF